MKAQRLETLLPRPSEDAREKCPGQGGDETPGGKTPHCYRLLETKSLGYGKGLGDCGVPSRKLAEEHGKKRPTPAQSETEGKERVEQ